MDWQKNRLWVAAVALAILGIVAGVAYNRNTGDTPESEIAAPRNFPDLDEDDITSLEITRPGEEPVHLERRDDTWFVTAPIEARADQSVVSTALDKLGELEVVGIAANNPEHHAELEVTAEAGIRVVVGGAEGTLADLWIGATRSSNTMVRVEGGDQVVSVRGSIKFAFNKALRDWRDRGVLDVESDDVIEIAWTGPNGSFHFRRPLEAAPAVEPEEGEDDEGDEAPAGPTYGDWEIVDVSYLPTLDPDAGVPEEPPAPLTTIENFAASRVRSIVTNLSRMRASDFAADGTTAASAGLTDPAAARVVLTIRDGDTTRTETVILGSESDAEDHEHYATRDGSEIVYVISRYLSDRVSPTAASFQQTAAAAAEEPPPSDGEMPAGGGAPSMDDLPPDIRRALEEAMRGGGAPH